MRPEVRSQAHPTAGWLFSINQPNHKTNSLCDSLVLYPKHPGRCAVTLGSLSRRAGGGWAGGAPWAFSESGFNQCLARGCSCKAGRTAQRIVMRDKVGQPLPCTPARDLGRAPRYFPSLIRLKGHSNGCGGFRVQTPLLPQVACRETLAPTQHSGTCDLSSPRLQPGPLQRGPAPRKAQLVY